MTDTPNTELLKQLPQVEEVLQSPELTSLEGIPRDIITDAVRAQIDALRQRILSGAEPSIETSEIAQAAAARAAGLSQPSLRRVINASGVIIHTNLGRSVMAQEAIEAVNEVIAGYSTL